MPIASGILAARSVADNCLSADSGMLRYLARISGRRRHARRGSTGPGGPERPSEGRATAEEVPPVTGCEGGRTGLEEFRSEGCRRDRDCECSEDNREMESRWDESTPGAASGLEQDRSSCPAHEGCRDDKDPDGHPRRRCCCCTRRSHATRHRRPRRQRCQPSRIDESPRCDEEEPVCDPARREDDSRLPRPDELDPRELRDRSPSDSTIATATTTTRTTRTRPSRDSCHPLLRFVSGVTKGCRLPPYLATILIISYTLFGIADACSSRSTPKPRPPAPTPRPNITFHMYTCPPDYAEWYCLNGATCFTVKIVDSLLYNCLCANGYIGQRCEFKDLDGSYLPSRQRVMLETASIAGGATIAVFLVVIICIAAYIHCKRKQKELRTGGDTVDGPGRDPELRPFSNRSRSLMMFTAKNSNNSTTNPSIEQTRMPGWNYPEMESTRMVSISEGKRSSQ